MRLLALAILAAIVAAALLRRKPVTTFSAPYPYGGNLTEADPRPWELAARIGQPVLV